MRWQPTLLPASKVPVDRWEVRRGEREGGATVVGGAQGPWGGGVR